MIEQQFTCWRKELLPALARHGIEILDPAELEGEDRAFLENYYATQVRPVLTPLGVDPSHPFPQLLNKSLNLVVSLEIERNGEVERRLGAVQVPRVLPRLVRLPRQGDAAVV